MVRLVSGVVLAAGFFALVWYTNATVLLVVALGVATLAVHEYVQLFRLLDASVPAIPTMVATWAIAIVVPFPYAPVEVVVAIGLMLIAVWSLVRLEPGSTTDGPDFKRASTGIAAAALAPVYIGLPLGTLVGIHIYGGRGAVILLMATIVVSDSAQFYSGRLFGRRLLAPRVSPKKTVEGAIGGFLLAPLFMVASSYYFVPAATSQLAVAVLAVALVGAGVAGDLFKSMLKRAAGVKDSSALIPGHGGVIDRIDALLFASPIFYLYIRELFS